MSNWSKEQIVKEVSALDNRSLLEETLELGGGDYQDGCFTSKGAFKYGCLKSELESRLDAIGFISFSQVKKNTVEDFYLFGIYRRDDLYGRVMFANTLAKIFNINIRYFLDHFKRNSHWEYKTYNYSEALKLFLALKGKVKFELHKDHIVKDENGRSTNECHITNIFSVDQIVPL